MHEGKVALGDTTAGLVLHGYSYLEMFFLEHDKEPLTVYKPGPVRHAWRCHSCGTLVIVSNKPDSMKCFQCGSKIEEDETVCSQCGWTYERAPTI